MATPDGATRTRGDACPGVLRLTEAADGAVARIRLPGGFVTGAGLAALATAAAELGDGRIALTSRGNVQLRGLATDAGADLGARLHAAGLWPSATHDRVRNIVASPLAGLDRPGDLTGLVHALDAALCAAPRLAALPGRFLVAVDDGRGDVAGLGADVLVDAGGATVGGLTVDDPVAAVLAWAAAFLDERAAQGGGAWRVAELTDGAARVRARTAALLGTTAHDAAVGRTATHDAATHDVAAHDVATGGAAIGGAATHDVAMGGSAVRRDPSSARCGPPVPGPLDQTGGGRALVAAVPLGRMDAAQARWLASATTGTARITPWRSVVLPDITDDVVDAAARNGFGVTADTPWATVTACTGRPGCAKALADVQADAAAAVRRWPGRPVHWSGCARRCGRPAHTAIDVVATETGYRIDGGGVPDA